MMQRIRFDGVHFPKSIDREGRHRFVAFVDESLTRGFIINEHGHVCAGLRLTVTGSFHHPLTLVFVFFVTAFENKTLFRLTVSTAADEFRRCARGTRFHFNAMLSDALRGFGGKEAVLIYVASGHRNSHIYDFVAVL